MDKKEREKKVMGLHEALYEECIRKYGKGKFFFMQGPELLIHDAPCEMVEDLNMEKLQDFMGLEVLGRVVNE